MTSVSLTDWDKNGWLKPHQTSAQEIADLFDVAARDIADCQVHQVSADWRLNIAYNAALQVAIAALAAAGYRAAREAHHYRAIQSLAFTIGADAAMVSKLDQFRKKRNLGEYERAGRVSDQEAAEMLKLAIELRDKVRNWIGENHRPLFPSP